jgi:hypothetical protein
LPGHESEAVEALRQLRILVGSPSRAEDAAFRSILPNVGRTLRLVWQARLCLDEGVSPDGAPDEVRRLFPPKPNLAAEKPFVQGKVMRLARTVNLASLTRCLAVLSEADARLKGILPGLARWKRWSGWFSRWRKSCASGWRLPSS